MVEVAPASGTHQGPAKASVDPLISTSAGKDYPEAGLPPNGLVYA
jgi:hypothetical protein